MRILQVNKFLYPRAGTEAAVFGLAEWLRSRGHEVFFFSMKDPRNIGCGEEPFFVERIDYAEARGWGKARAAAKIVYSVEAERKMEALVEARRPDIVHLHNFHHQLSPSILRPLRRRGIPTVMTVHDLKIVCPNYLMLSGGRICERCKRHRYYHCLLQGCVKDSRAASLVNTIEMTLHWLLGSHEGIDVFITPSAFYREKLAEWGIPRERVLHVPNPVAAGEYAPREEAGDYVVFAGRMAREKGLGTLVRALRKAPSVRCRVAGAGPEEGEARALARELGAGNAEFLGFVPREEARELMARSRATVLPSEWYENGPMAALESLALGRPVIGARIGGIPELVQDGVTGLLFTPGAEGELAECLKRVMENAAEARRMGLAGRRLIETAFTPERSFGKIAEVYEATRRRKAG